MHVYSLGQGSPSVEVLLTAVEKVWCKQIHSDEQHVVLLLNRGDGSKGSDLGFKEV